MVKLKGHEINAISVTSAFGRKSVQFKSSIISILGTLGVSDYDVEVPIESIAIKKAKASATWYMAGHQMYYSYSLRNKFVDNLYVVYKVIEMEANLVLSEKKTLDEFIAEFKEDADIVAKRKLAREFLGLDHDVNDMEVINKKYKDMAKELHPDTPTGNTEKFKQLNDAHKTLKRELS